MPIASESFYKNILKFNGFENFCSETFYRQLPDDWWIYSVRVRDIDSLIKKGRQRDINILTVSALTTSMKALSGFDFPYVFRGYEALIFVPKGKKETLCQNLASLSVHAEKLFGFGLDIFHVPMQAILSRGGQIFVGKYELMHGRSLSFIKGSGRYIFDDLLFDEKESFRSEAVVKCPPLFEGLSCRWEPILSEKGVTLTLSIMPQENHGIQVCEKVAKEISYILDYKLDEANPVLNQALRYKSFFACLRDEAPLHEKKLSLSYLASVMQMFFCILVFRLRLPNLFFTTSEYVSSLAAHSDFRKYDNQLLFVLDCSVEQGKRIVDFLKVQHRFGHIYFGIQESDRSYMTCYVESVASGGHIHFLDGGDGGFASAQRALNEQRRAADSQRLSV